MKTWMIRIAFAAACVVAACAKTTAPSFGGETGWLVACDDDGACAEGSCVCGVCSQACDAEDSCVGAFEGACVDTSDGAGRALCAGQAQATAARVCLPSCAASAECGDGFACDESVCVPERETLPNDGGPDSTVPDSTVPDSTVPDALDTLATSLQTWNELLAETGAENGQEGTYYYAEENCLVNATEHTVTWVQVTPGMLSILSTSMIPSDECRGSTNRYETFVAATLPELYAQCEALLRREGDEVTLELDALGVIRACTWPGGSDCLDNCGEGFYLLELDFGTAIID